MKVRVDNHLQKGDLAKYKKEHPSATMVMTTTPWLIKYINVVFVRVDAITEGQIKQEYDIKNEKLGKIEKIYKYDFRDGETLEQPTP